MKRALKRIQSEIYYYNANGARVDGAPPWLTGNTTSLRGNVIGLRGNVIGLRGNVTGLWGNMTGITGNLDKCELTDEERAAGVDIDALVSEE